MIKRAMLSVYILFFSIFASAQDKGVSMADEMRANGKIYVVVAVVLTIFAGIILYLVRLDRKMSRLEREVGFTRPDREKQNKSIISK